MKHLIFIIYFTFIILAVNAQSLKVTSGENISNYLDYDSFKLFTQDSLNIYAFLHNKQNYYLDIFDKGTLKKEISIKIPLPSLDTMNYDLQNLFVHDSIYQVLYSYFDKKSKLEKLEMINFNKQGIQSGNTKLIDVSEGKNKRKAGGFSVFNRATHKEFLSYGYKYKDDTTYINIDHFDYFGNKLRSQDFVLEDISEIIVFRYIDDDCNLYFLTRSKRGNRNVTWQLRRYSPDNGDQQKVDLKEPSLEKVYLSNFFRMYKDREGRISFLSPYSSRPSSKYAEGIYIAEVNLGNFNSATEHVIPFKTQGDTIDASTFSLSSCIIEDILPMQNNRLKLVFESRLHIASGMYGITTSNEYDIGDIITVDIDSSCAITEIHKIRKQQKAYDEDYKYTGFATLIEGSETYFIYNDLRENLLLTPDKIKKNKFKDNSTIIYASVENKKVMRKKLLDAADRGINDRLLPYTALSAWNELYVFMQIKNDLYLSKISVDH